MNIALEGTTEWVNGEAKSSYGDAFIRGNNGESKSFTEAQVILLMPVAFSQHSTIYHCSMTEAT